MMAHYHNVSLSLSLQNCHSRKAVEKIAPFFLLMFSNLNNLQSVKGIKKRGDMANFNWNALKGCDSNIPRVTKQ